jgi:hypothetical protein
MATRQTTIRFSKRTDEQLTELAALFGDVTKTIAIAVDRLYIEEVRSRQLIFYTTSDGLADALKRRPGITHVISEHGDSEATLYYTANGKKQAAVILSKIVRESHDIAQRRGHTTLLHARVEVSTRTGYGLADIDRCGRITQDADALPEASYFSTVLTRTIAPWIQ